MIKYLGVNILTKKQITQKRKKLNNNEPLKINPKIFQFGF